MHQRGAVEEAQVDALASERMNRVSGIADEREPVLAILARMREPQRKVRARRCDFDLAEDAVERILERFQPWRDASPGKP